MSFTMEETARLTPYVSNFEGHIFALTNLPQVVRGALFSRYSRSELGLRELLLKEFLQTHPLSSSDEQAATGGIDQEKAEAFYKRVLDEYGDDSVAELGGAHLAIEQVSLLAAKALQEPRIGGSPLEKSTRYVWFGKNQEREYPFYQDPKLLSHSAGSSYLDACRMLFIAYEQCFPRVEEQIVDEWPYKNAKEQFKRNHNAQLSERAWRSTVKARAFDAVRGLLPASTFTNMGIYGNGRFFENWLGRLHRAPLSELQQIGATAQQELGKVIGPFVNKADPQNAHAQAREHYHAQLHQLQEENVAAIQFAPCEARNNHVRLLQAPPDPVHTLLTGMQYAHVDQDWSLLSADLSKQPAKKVEALAAIRTNRRHKLPRSAELLHYHFEVECDFGAYRDLQRHRMMTQQRQRLHPFLGYWQAPEISAAGMETPYHAAIEQAAQCYAALQEDFPHEAQYVVPIACQVRWHMYISLRELVWLVELRSTPQGHAAYRHIAQEMYAEVMGIHPVLKPLFKFVDLSEAKQGRASAEQRKHSRQQS